MPIQTPEIMEFDRDFEDWFDFYYADVVERGNGELELVKLIAYSGWNANKGLMEETTN